MSEWMIFVLVLGLGALALGAEMMVRGAARLGTRAGISPLVVGLTIVALGTSAPEMVVSVYASLAGKADIAVANAVGSNIFNTLFVLGLCALVAPLVSSPQLLQREMPLCIGVSIAFALMGANGRIGMLEGGILVAGAALYMAASVRAGRAETRALPEAAVTAVTESWIGTDRRARAWVPGWGKELVLVAAGLGLLVLGARWLVDGAVGVARFLGVSEAVIGLTIVAAGTSLPEVATSVMATVRGQRDMAIGNAIGSNIFNILLILGVSAVSAGGRLAVSPAMMHLDIPVMIAAAIACLALLRTGRVLARWEGGLLLGCYAAYLAVLIQATRT